MIRPRRLLSLGHSYVVTMNRRLAHELAKAGGQDWEVTVAAPTYFAGTNDLRPVRLEANGAEPCRLVPLSAHLTSRVHVFFYGWRLRSLLAEPWDVVHCWEEPFILVGGQVARWTRRDSALVFWTYQNLNKKYPIPFNWIERYAMSRAAGYICSGQLVKQNLAPRRGYGDRPTEVIPLGVDLERFRPNADAGKAIRQKLGWTADGPPVIGYLGRLIPEKGLDVLTRALDQLTTPWRALFVGAGTYEADLKAWASKHGDLVRICTDVVHDQVPAYLNAMDMVCAPSQTTPKWMEQFGRMVVEAMASGVAFIGSTSGEIPNVTGDAGIIVDEKDADAWARAIAELLESPGRRIELVERGLHRVREEFAWPVVARRHLDFFDRVLEAKHSAT